MTTFKESKTIFFLALPLIIGQIGQMLLGLVDSVMIARLGVTELAALTMANNLFNIPFIFGIGIMTCVSIRTANEKGANNPSETQAICINGTHLSLIIGSLFFFISWLSSHHLDLLNQDPEVTIRSKEYFIIISLSLIPGILAATLKNHADALNRMWAAFSISMASVAINILLNWILIYGKLGAPAMGLEGAGYATLISRTLLAISMIIWFTKDTKLAQWTPHKWLQKINWKELSSLLKLGFPAGLHILTEVGAFVMSGIMMGWVSKEALAAQQIAMVCTGTAFMIPLGISIALTMRVAERRGKKLTSDIRSTYLSGWLLTLILSSLTALLFIIYGKQLATLFISDTPSVISFATSFLIVAGVFQIVDGQQVASAGMLRGHQDTKTPAMIAFFSYWIIGIPFGYTLAFHTKAGAVGIWWGLALGLTVACILLAIRVWKFNPSKQII